MRVSFFSNFHQPCGIADYSTQFLNELAKLVEVKIVQSPLPSQVPYKYSSYVYYAKEFRRCAKELNNADICHIQHDYSFWGGVKPLRNLFPYMASAIRVPVVLTAHEILHQPFKMADFKGVMRWLSFCLSPCSRRYSDFVSPGLHRWADMTVVHTGQQKDMLVEQGVSPHKITIIPHGIPSCNLLTLDTEKVIRRFGFAGKRLLTIIGFISARKGYELVLKIMPLLPDDVMLVIAGGCRTKSEEEYLASLQESIDHSRMSHRVVITGYLGVGDLHAIVQMSNVILAPFKAVAGSGTLSLAFALGRPVIASMLVPMMELNETARSMLLFSIDDSDDLLTKIQMLILNDQLSNELSKSALSYADQYSMKSIAVKTVSLYKQILGSRSE